MRYTFLTFCLLTAALMSAQARFSVSPTSQVEFAQANLQYCPQTNEFRLAPHPWTIIGLDNEKVSEHYQGWIDLFGWATSGYDNRSQDPDVVYTHPYNWQCRLEHSGNPRNPFGYGPSTTQAEASLIGTSAAYDWGVYNAIAHAGNVPGMWRTLTREEWHYVLFERPNARQLRQLTTVHGVYGLMLLPDDCAMSITDNWKQMAKAGAVFLPAAGVRYHLSVSDVAAIGTYWSATAAGNDAAYFVGIYRHYVAMSTELYGRNAGRCVRLVRDLRP